MKDENGYTYIRVPSSNSKYEEVGDLVPLEDDYVLALNPEVLKLDLEHSRGQVIKDHDDGYYSVDFKGSVRLVRADDVALLDEDGHIAEADDVDPDLDVIYIGEEVPVLHDRVVRLTDTGLPTDMRGIVIRDMKNGWYEVSFGYIKKTLRADQIKLSGLTPDLEKKADKRLFRWMFIRSLLLVLSVICIIVLGVRYYQGP